jgi:hypothetical protein
MNFPDIGLKTPRILLPKKNIDHFKWSVIACDQFTSERDYWQKVEDTVGVSPSMLRLILPEVYLEDGDEKERIKNINLTAKKYLEEEVLEDIGESFVFLKRKTPYKDQRLGLVIALDLDQYDYSQKSEALIRATEKTIVERIPPRVEIRKNLDIESPHIMVLIDDPKKTVIEPLLEEDLEKVYDTDLMLNGGHLTGYKVNNENLINQIANNLRALADIENIQEKYELPADKITRILYAMGDGNHSLATAKAIWEDIKGNLSEEEYKNHPARFALVELVNLHDESLEFEPIHRIMFNVDKNDLLLKFKDYLKSSNSEIIEKEFDNLENLLTKLKSKENTDLQKLAYLTKNKYVLMQIKNPPKNLAVASLQEFLDDYLKNNNEAKIDYIHGEKPVEKLAQDEKNIGFLLPEMPKSELMKSIILDGALPRKTFSMGHAEEKRYYFECRKIV